MSGHGVPHHAENPEQKRIGIFIAVLAVIMAIVSALTNQQANLMLLKQVTASNNYAWYQAKKQRSSANEAEIRRDDFELAGNPTEAQKSIIQVQKAKLLAKNAEYEIENKNIQQLGDADKAVAAVAEHRHHYFEFAEIALHIAVVLCSLVLLTEQKLFLHLGLAATVLGIALACLAQFGNHHHEEHEEGGHAPTAPPAAGAPAAPAHAPEHAPAH